METMAAWNRVQQKLAAEECLHKHTKDQIQTNCQQSIQHGVSRTIQAEAWHEPCSQGDPHDMHVTHVYQQYNTHSGPVVCTYELLPHVLRWCM